MNTPSLFDIMKPSFEKVGELVSIGIPTENAVNIAFPEYRVNEAMGIIREEKVFNSFLTQTGEAHKITKG